MKCKIIPTDHLIPAEAIEGIIKDESPDIICLELCEFREKAIFNELTKEIIESKKTKIPLLQKITDSIKEKAKKANLDYGSDQKTALRYASDNKIKYYLVDMPILKIQELFSKIPEKEQIGFQSELKAFESESIKTKVNEEEVLFSLKQKYPIAFEFLVNMRNLYITNQILKVMIKNEDKKILVFLGKGHAKNVEKMLEGGMK